MSVYDKNGPVVRVLYLVIAVIGYLLVGGGRWFRLPAVVLCYHGILDGQKRRFREQMAHIAPRARGQDAGARPIIQVTFDDAFENLIENALPSLKEYHIPALIFAVPGNVGQTPQWNIAPNHPEYNEKIMTRQQLSDMQAEGICFGSHTQTHPDLSRLPREQVREELMASKKTLENWLGKPIEDLALPHGAFNHDVLCLAKEAGYRRIYTLEPKGTAGPQATGLIGRFSMSPDVWPLEFYFTCVGAYCWLGPWRKIVRSLRTLCRR